MQSKMMKYIIILAIGLASISARAQTENPAITKEELEKELVPLKENIQYLQKINADLKTKVIELNVVLKQANDTVKVLEQKINENVNSINQTANQLSARIAYAEETTHKKIDRVDQSLSLTSLYSLIGGLAIILLSVLTYWILSRKQQSDKNNLTEQLANTKFSIEERLVNEFIKQTGLIETQLQLIEQQKDTPATSYITPDHSLALKVAGEINLIERNISLMDKSIKGIKQLARSVSKLKDNLVANGYEMPELLGKQFHQGMKIIVTNSVPDESLEKGSEIITKVLIPQVNYNDKMIQTAQIEVSVGF